LSEFETATGFLPPQGAAVWYDILLRLLENRQIAKVDKAFLQNQEPKIASGNEAKLIAGLKFLGLIDKEGNATESMNDLSLKGEKRRENLEKVVRKAYCLLFDKVKMKLEDVDPDTLINAFKTDYMMKSINTAEQAARIFVFLAQQAGIPLSQSILDNLSVSLDKAKKLSEIPKKLRGAKKKEEEKPEETDGEEITEKGMYVGRLGDSILIKLRKSSDKSTREKIAQRAKTLIDLYVEGEVEGN
jgi:hypothetical protein